jgi:uncharacterized protein (TIGR02722 family)
LRLATFAGANVSFSEGCDRRADGPAARRRHEHGGNHSRKRQGGDHVKHMLTGAWITAAAVLISGCSAFRMSVRDAEPGAESRLSAKYDEEDLLSLAKSMSDAIVAHPFPAADEASHPIVAPMGIRNATKTHIDTEALMDTVTTHLLDTGSLRLVNTDQRDTLLKEQGYQLANCTPETRTAIGKQLGARYILTGRLAEIEKKSGREVRVSRKQDVYYQLTMEVTDLQTGLVVLRKQKDRLRRASKPIIGW